MCVHSCMRVRIYNFFFTFSTSRLHFDYSHRTNETKIERKKNCRASVFAMCMWFSCVFYFIHILFAFPALCAARFNINCTCVYQMQRHIQHVHNTTRFTKSKRQQIGTDNAPNGTEDELTKTPNIIEKYPASSSWRECANEMNKQKSARSSDLFDQNRYFSAFY